MGDIFFSYSQTDREVVGGLVQRLEQRGFSIWWDGEIPPGEEFRSFIDRKLNEAPAICVVWSSNSVQSRWVAEEAEEGARRTNLIPISIDDADIPRGFRGFQAAQLQQSASASRYEQEFEKLVQRLQQVASQDKSVRPRRKRQPSALSYRSARNQNLWMTIFFTFVTLAFAFYDYLVDPGNLSSIWFRIGVVTPVFLVFAAGFFFAHKAWHLWLLNVAASCGATWVVVLQIQRLSDPAFDTGGLGQIITACIVMGGAGAGYAHSHSSRAASLAGVLATYLGLAYYFGATGLSFWATAIANLTVLGVFIWLGFFLRDRRPK